MDTLVELCAKQLAPHATFKNISMISESYAFLISCLVCFQGIGVTYLVLSLCHSCLVNNSTFHVGLFWDMRKRGSCHFRTSYICSKLITDVATLEKFLHRIYRDFSNLFELFEFSLHPFFFLPPMLLQSRSITYLWICEIVKLLSEFILDLLA